MPRIYMFFDVNDEQFATLLARGAGAQVIEAAQIPGGEPAPVAVTAQPSAATAAAVEAEADKKKGRGRPKKDAAPAAPAPVAATTMPPMPAPGGFPPMPVAPVAPQPVSYDQVLAKFNELQGAGKMTDAHWGAALAAAGTNDPATLNTNETQRRAVMDYFEKL